MQQADRALIRAVREQVAALGYELADVRRRGSGRRTALQVRVDRLDAAPGRGITIDECTQVSRALSGWLDETQLLGPHYALEVSSPGIERPVRWLEHWQRFTGRDVQVRLAGRGRVRATIVRVLVDEDAVVLRPAGDAEEVTVPIDEAHEATLAVDWDALQGRSG